MRTIKGGRLPIKSWCEDIEDGAMAQAKALAELPFAVGHVALMPDCHQGFGMPIGAVLACEGVIIPNAVGVDIGCGMRAVRAGLHVDALGERRVAELVARAAAAIPLGFAHHRKPQGWEGFDAFPGGDPFVASQLDAAKFQLGTLGGGNHFIEFQRDADGAVWLMIHSGSRNFGLQIAEHYHAKAVEICPSRFPGVPKDLSCLPLDTKQARNYIQAMRFALDFARENRARMMAALLDIFAEVTGCSDFGAPLDIHHNYAEPAEFGGVEVWLHRKGATAARGGQPGIIPGSMGTASYIVEGKGEPESFESCSHGAGRRLGRGEACRVLDKESCDRDMAGIVFTPWGRSRKGGLDLSEAPAAYKDIDAVMAAQADLVEVKVKLRPLGVVKG